MKIIVDTNLVFSAILNTNSRVADLLMNSTGQFEFLTCNQLRTELLKHHEKLKRASGLNDSEIDVAKFQVLRFVSFISEEQIPFEYWAIAAPLVRDVDADDISFIALAEFLQAKLWTGDKKLINGLRAKGYPNCRSTDEIFQLRHEIEQAR